MPGNPLTDPLLRSDLRSQELAYNNNTDRMKIELPERGDPAASGYVIAGVEDISPVQKTLLDKAFTYTVNGDIETIKTRVSGETACLLQTFSYDGSFNITDIVETQSTW